MHAAYKYTLRGTPPTCPPFRLFGDVITGRKIAAIPHAWSPPVRPVVAISEHMSRFGSPQALGVARHMLPERVVVLSACLMG